MRNALATSCLVLLVASLVGCVAEDASSKAPVEGSSDSLTANDPMVDEVDVQEGRLVFSPNASKLKKLSDLKGQVNGFAIKTRNNEPAESIILVGKRASNAVMADGSIRQDVKNKNGYLRVATSVEDGPHGEMIVHTRPANFFEAHEELARQGIIEPHVMRAADGQDDGWEFSKVYPFTILDINLNRTIYEKNLLAGLGKVSLGLEDSYLRVNGDLDAYARGKWVSPKEAHAILTTKLEGKLNLVARFDGGFSGSTGEQKLYQRQFSIASVAGHPLALEFTVVANCDFGANGKAVAEAGATVNGQLVAGGEYIKDQGSHLIWNPTMPQFARIGPSLTSQARVEAICTLTARAKAQIFDQNGPEVVGSAFVHLDANAQGGASPGSASGMVKAKVIGGIDAYAAGTLEPFGIDLLTIQTPTYHKEWVLFDQTISTQ